MGRPRRRSVLVTLVVAAAGCALAASAQDAPDAGVRAIGAGAATPTRTLADRRPALPLGAPIAVRTGFVPDPIVIRGRLGLDAPLGRLGGDCHGLSTEQPSQRVQMTSRFGFLRIFATGAADLTLAVQTAQGVVCSDDRFGRHPAIEGRFAPGELAIWIGANGTVADDARGFELEITETRSIRPGVRRGEEDERLSLAIEAGLDTQPEAGTHGDIRLRRGFLPDPRFLSGTVVPDERPVDVGGLGDTCRGYLAARPSHVIVLREDLDFFQVYVAEAAESTTIVVVAPDQSVSCDSSEGDHPNVTRAAWPAGTYRVWVGAHRTDASFPYRLGLSEIRRVR